MYPPHLQLACSALFDQLAPGEDVLALRHYEKLGGLDEIVRDYLDRVLETELPSELVATARRVLLALVDSDRSRAVRTDAELAVLCRLTSIARRARGVALPRHRRAAARGNGQPAWELVHDSLVPRVLAWSDRQDLARQRAIEIVRHHLRGSGPSKPSLLTAAELREVRPQPPRSRSSIENGRDAGRRRGHRAGIVEQSRRARRMRIVGSVALNPDRRSEEHGFLGGALVSRARAAPPPRAAQQGRHRHVRPRASHVRLGSESGQFRVPVASAASQLEWSLFETSTVDDLAAGATPRGSNAKSCNAA